jgi:hypothetical protein
VSRRRLGIRHRIVAIGGVEHLRDAERQQGFLRAAGGIVGRDAEPEAGAVQAGNRILAAGQRHRLECALLGREAIEEQRHFLAVPVVGLGIPERDDVGIGAGGKDRVGAEAGVRVVVAGERHQRVGPLPVAIGGVQGHQVGQRVPGLLEIDQCPVLVEQDASYVSQTGVPPASSLNSRFLRQRAGQRSALMCLTSPAVDASCFAASSLPSTTGKSSVASSLPSSTPHWSKELMSNIVPSTNTRCS